MFKCFFIRRKLYDYLENGLSESQTLKVRRHLGSCPSCQGRLNALGHLLGLAKNKGLPGPDENFWHNFQIDLDAQINKRLLPEFKLRPVRRYNLRPVAAYVSLSAVLLVMFSVFFHSKLTLSTKPDSSLVDEATLLYELSDETTSETNEDDLIEELNLFDLMERSPV